MFKPARWWSDKNKLKVVFKLQFHASQVTQVGGNGLMISVVPSDTGKPTVKLGKATVRDGSCLWENPVYETVKFNQDPRSGKIHERMYHFIVGTGASKSGVVGEASIDFSNYVESTKASSISLPLKNPKCEGVLHVSIQRVLESMDQREIEEIENADGTIRTSSVEDVPSNKTVSEAEFKPKHRGSSGSDVTLSSSVSSSGVEAPWELKNDNADEGLKSDEHQRSWEWLGNSAVEDSTDDSSSTVREAFVNEHSDDLAIERLKTDVAALSRQVEMSELELQALRKQIVKENKRGQDLWGEVVCLKQERDAFKAECEQLNGTRSKSNLFFDAMDSGTIVEELKQELNHAKEMNSNLRIQLEKTQESNSELILAVQDLEEMLEQKNREKGMDDDDEEQKELEDLVKEHNDVKGSFLLERQIKDLHKEIEIYKRDKDDLEMQMEQLALDYEILKQANHDMSNKLQQSQIEEQLEFQYECSSPDKFVCELEMRVENLENELKRRSKEYEDSLEYAKSLEEELEKQAQGFEADLEVLTVNKIEQEKRAIRAEEMLKKIRWRNANTAERLQEEFRKLSVQLASTFETNEKLATNALAEANELRLQKSHLEEMLRKSHEEIEHQKKQAEDTHKVLTDEICMLKDEIETHVAKNRILMDDMRSKEGVKKDLDQMRISIKELELIIELGNDEKTELERRVLVMKAEAEELRKELNNMNSVVKEKELVAGNLQSEVDSLQAHCTKLRNSQVEEEVEREKLRKQVLQLRNDLKKKEDCMEKKTKDGRGRATSVDAVRVSSKASKPHPRESKEVANLKERIKLLESQIKLKETALETSANAFLEKEKELINKIEELDRKLESIAHSCENEVEKAASAVVDKEEGNENGHLKTSSDLSEARAYVEELKTEMASLEERNKSVERDLKEMQERYLDISLKFAEVEGERQQLVMNLRNANKSS